MGGLKARWVFTMHRSSPAYWVAQHSWLAFLEKAQGPVEFALKSAIENSLQKRMLSSNLGGND
jgi:hypothetical protein